MERKAPCRPSPRHCGSTTTSRKPPRSTLSIFPNSSVEEIHRATEAGPGNPGDVLSALFVLDGTRFIGINGGPHFQFSEAVSFMVHCKDQAEVDYYWDRLRRRRRGVTVRLAQGPLRAELADLSGPVVRAGQAIPIRPAPPPPSRRCRGCARSSSPTWKKPSRTPEAAVAHLLRREIHSMVASLIGATSATSSHMVAISDASDMTAIRTRDSS